MFRIFDLLKSRARLSKVLAPVQGRLFPLEDVNDEIFASEGLDWARASQFSRPAT